MIPSLKSISPVFTDLLLFYCHYLYDICAVSVLIGTETAQHQHRHRTDSGNVQAKVEIKKKEYFCLGSLNDQLRGKPAVKGKLAGFTA